MNTNMKQLANISIPVLLLLLPSQSQAETVLADSVVEVLGTNPVELSEGAILAVDGNGDPIDYSSVSPEADGPTGISNASDGKFRGGFGAAPDDFDSFLDNFWYTEDVGGFPSDFFAQIASLNLTNPRLLFDLGSTMDISGFEIYNYGFSGGGHNSATKNATMRAGNDPNSLSEVYEIVDLPNIGNETSTLLDIGSTVSARYFELEITDNYYTSGPGGGDRVGFADLQFTLASISNADFDSDMDVDGEDFLTWQRGFGVGTILSDGDANGDGSVNGGDLAIWESQYGAVASSAAVSSVPEPATAVLLGLGSIGLITLRYRRK